MMVYIRLLGNHRMNVYKNFGCLFNEVEFFKPLADL
jgi:hypothetical protein